MPKSKSIVIDELHATFRVPSGTPESQCIAVKRVLDGTRFLTTLRRAIRDAVRRYPALTPVRMTLSR